MLLLQSVDQSLSQALYNTFGVWIYIIIPILTGVCTSFATEFVNLYSPKWMRPQIIVVLISALFAFLLCQVFSDLISGIWEWLLALIINFIIAVLFYRYLGPWTVDKAFKTLKSRISSESKEAKKHHERD